MYGFRFDTTALLREQGWPVAGVYAGGCVERGEGSSFRALAHTHTAEGDPFLGWICIRAPRRLLTPSGAPSRILRHEVAHVLAPHATHGSAAFIRALEAVGIRTDSYSRAGRRRRVRHSSECIERKASGIGGCWCHLIPARSRRG